MPIYQRNGKTYNIPDSEVEGFEKTYPDATQKYVANGRNYNIPVSERNGFISTYKDATPFDKAPSTTPEVKSVPSVSVVSQGVDSVKDYKPVIQEKPDTDFNLKEVMDGPTDSERKEQERKRIEEQIAQQKLDTGKGLKKAYQDHNRKEKEEDEQKGWFRRIVEGISESGRDARRGFPLSPVQTDENIRNLHAAAESVDNAEELFNESKHKEETGIGAGVAGFGRGFWDKMSKLSTWDMGMLDMSKSTAVLNAAHKFDLNQPLTGEEDTLLDAVALEAAANGEFSGDLGRGYKAGSTTAESLPFMAEFMVNPATGTGQAVGKAAAKKIIFNFGKEAAKSTIGKIARNSARVAGDIVGAGIMTGTTGVMRTTADAVDRSIGEVKPIVDSDGYYRFGGTEGGDGALEAFVKAYGASTIENFSEMFGNYLAPIGGALGTGAGKVMNKIGLGRVNKVIGDIKSSDVAKMIDDFQSKTQWNGTIGEYLEEQAGMAMNALTVGDNNLSDIVDVDTQIDTFLGVSAFGGLFSTIRTAGYAKQKYLAKNKLTESDREASDALGEGWKPLKEQIDNSDDEELISILSSTMSGQELDERQKQNVLLYAGRLKAYHGASLADLKRKTEGDTPDEIVQSQMNFDEGYKLAVADRVEKRKAFKELKKVEDKIDEEFLSADEEGQYDIIRHRSEAGEDVTNELAYIDASSKFNGMICGIRDGINEKVAQSNQYITRLSHSDGNIYDVTLSTDEKKHVFVINGSIVADENGIIDKKQSDTRFIVRDDTGKAVMRSVDDLYKLEASNNAESLKEVTAKAIREQESARYAEEIETPSEDETAKAVALIQPGDIVSLNMQGIAATAIVQSKRDGTTVLQLDDPVEYDGKKVQAIELPDEQLQAMIISKQEKDDNMLENALINDATQPIDESTLSDISIPGEDKLKQEEVNLETIGNEMPIQDVPVATSVIPTDDKGNMLYHKAPVELTIADLNDGNLTSDEADGLIAANKKEATKQLKKTSEKPPKIGINKAKYLEEKRKWTDAVADINSQIAYWNEVEVQLQAIREQPGDTTANDIKTMGEPLSGNELAAQLLGTGKLPLLYGDYKRETGFNYSEAKGMFGLFATKENGGMTIEQAGEQLMLADLEAGTNFFDQDDPNAGRNAIVDILSSVRTRGGLTNYIESNREDMAERERRAEVEANELAKEQWYQDNYHMTPEEYETYEEAIADDSAKRSLSEKEYNEFMSTFVDEQNLNSNEQQRVTREGKNSREILSGEEPVQTGRAGGIEEESTEVDGSVIGENGVIPESASGGVEILSQDSKGGVPSLSLDDFLKSRPEVPGYLYHGSPEGDLNMIDPFAHTQNWREGIGFYTTESRDAAQMYADGRTAKGERKASAGKVNYIKPNPDARILDMDAEVDSKLWEGISINMDLYPPMDAKTNREAYRELIEMADNPEAQYAIEEALLANGYDASTHMEGANGNPHRVTIWKNPDKLPLITRPEDVYSESLPKIDEESPDSNKAVNMLRQIEGESILDYAERVVKANEITQEREKVNANPTDAQKEAGNYKKGHVEINGLDMTIENPRGSERSGVDANGETWSITMNNDYGYIRGTVGVDGDHIDVFLGNSGNGVYVVDQLKEDGSFDEHKVMYGFGSMDEAKEAYLSNYSPGWKGLGVVTEVSKDEFQKWIQLSKRKTKPFAEYKSVQPINVESSQNLNEEQSIIANAKKNRAYMKAPNGEPTRLDERQWVQVRTKAFKDWFGDWENDTKNASKVVDANGEPLVVYHGTSAGGFTIFNTYGSNFGLFGQGSYFTDNREVAESYTAKGKGNNKQVYGVFLNIRHPMDMNSRDIADGWKDVLPDDIDVEIGKDATNESIYKSALESFEYNEYPRGEAQEILYDLPVTLGYDGVTHIGGGRYNDKDDTRHRVWIAMEPTQIKSATENSGEYSGENGDIRFREVKEQDGSKSLVGLHNISGDKLRKALKLGGFANPSAAVIDIDKQSHEGYGEISLVLPSSMVAKSTGRNAGTFSGDAWTPTYPQIERQFNDEGSKRVYDDISKLPKEMQSDVRSAWNGYMEGRDANALAYQFLYEKGEAPELRKIEPVFSEDIRKKITGVDAIDDYDERNAAILKAYIDEKFDGDRTKFEEYIETRKRVLQKKIDEDPTQKGFVYRRAVENLKDIEENGYEYNSVKWFYDKVMSDIRKSGGIDTYQTVQDVHEKISQSAELSKEYDEWKENLADKYGIKEVLFKGYTPSGNRVYLPHTLENVSKMMRQQGLAGATGWGGSFSKFAAGLMKPVGTLNGIRQQKGKLTTNHEEIEAFREKWKKVYFDLGLKLNPDASAFDDTGLYRVEEIATKPNSRSFAKREYGVELSDEDVRQLSDMVAAIRNEYPAMYFETKFERPVFLNEFAAAVVPDNASKDIVDAMNGAGIKVFTYKAGDETSRNEAVENASHINGVRFREDSMKTYHGSGAEFDKFNLSHSGEGEGESMIGKGIYTTRDKRIAEEYAGVAGNREVAGRKHLYEVEIPADNGGNYLDYDKVYDAAEMSEIAGRLHDAGVDVDFGRYFHDGKANGMNLYMAMAWNMPEGVDVNRVLSDAGYVGYKYSTRHDLGGKEKRFPKKSYVVFDESHATITGHEQIVSEIEKISDTLHTPVKIVRGLDELPEGAVRKAIEKGRNVKGWFDTKTGEVVIYLPNAKGEEDAKATFLHEIVGHKGLRALFGEKSYDDEMVRIYGQLPVEVRKRVADGAIREYGGDIAIAMDEFLAEQAERNEVPSWWDKVASSFRDFLRKMGISLELSDNDVRYLLWRSRKNLERNNPLEIAADVDMRNKLGIGEYGTRAERFRETTDKESLFDSAERIVEQAKISKNYDNAVSVVNEFHEKCPGACKTLVIKSKDTLRSQMEAIHIDLEDIDKYERWFDENKTIAFYVPKYGRVIVLDTNYSKEDLNAYLWHENVHAALNNLENRDDVISRIVPLINTHVNYIIEQVDSGYSDKSDDEKREEYVTHFFEELLINEKESLMLNGDVRLRDVEANNAIKEILNYINNGREKEYDGSRSDISRRRTGDNGGGKIAFNEKMRYPEGNIGYEEESGRVWNDLRSILNEGEERLRRKIEEESTGSGVNELSLPEREGIARQMYEDSLDKTKNKMYRWREAYQDSMLALKNLQEAIVKESREVLKHFEDAYMAENQMSSRSSFETEVYKDKFFVPMMDAIKKITDQGVDRKEVNIYVMAKHGLERNEVFAKRDAEQAANNEFDEKISEVNKLLDEGSITHEEWEEKTDELKARKADLYEQEYVKNRQKDYSGLTQLTDEKEGYEEAAKDIVESFEDRFDTKELWGKINLATKQTLKKSYESGLMTKATYKKINSMFEYYVPLRGFEDEVASDVYDYVLSDKSPFNAPVQVAKGRESQADDPFATIGNMAESGILQGNRNLMKQKFLNMVMNHPTSLVTVKTMWYERVVTGDKEEWVESFPEIKEGATPDEVSEAIEEHERRMLDLEKDRLSIRTTSKINLDYRASKREKNEHIVVVKSGGKEYVIYINGNPRAAQAINGLTNPDSSDNKFMKGIQWLDRQMAANFTTRNPAFVLSNMSRDVIFSTSAIWVKEDWKYAKRFDKNIAKNIGAIAGLMARYKSGRLNMSVSRDRHFLEFLENGGETGYAALHNVDEYKKMMDRHVKKSNGALGSVSSGVHAIVDAVSFMNRCAENVSRFTTYQTSREMGRGISESIRDAKEVTVNFNKKGAGMKSEGWAGWSAQTFKSFFLFFNAAVQSLKNFKDLHDKSKSKFYTSIGGFASAGILLPMINNAIIEMLVGDEDDDMTDEERAEWARKRSAYDNLPEWVRKNNFCIWVGGERFVTIPLPIELRAFYGLGEMWYQMGRGNMNGIDGKIDVKKASLEMVNQLTELLPINPLGGNGDALSVIVPDAGKPLYQVFRNKDFFGKPIYKKGDYNELMPAWTKAFSGTAKWMVNSAEFINEVSGGDKYMQGEVDLNPATIEHVFEGYFGGMGKTANQLYKTISMIWDEDERMWRNVPVANRFVSGSDNKIEFRKVNEVYYQCMDELKETEQRLRGYENEAEMGIEQYAEKYDFLNESKENERYQVMKEYKSFIDELQKAVKESDAEEKKDIEMKINLLKMEMIGEVQKIR